MNGWNGKIWALHPNLTENDKIIDDTLEFLAGVHQLKCGVRYKSKIKRKKNSEQ